MAPKRPNPAHAAPTRPQLLKALDEAARRIGAQSVLMSDLVAARVGLHPTDLECLDLLCLAGPTTAGQLAAHTGLTSGAMTAAIDRLEAAGFVTRRRDERDRRVVLVDVVESGVRAIEPLYRPLIARLEKVNAGYDDRQLQTVLQYLSAAFEATAEHIAWLQSQPPASKQRCRHLMTGVELLKRTFWPAGAAPQEPAPRTPGATHPRSRS